MLDVDPMKRRDSTDDVSQLTLDKVQSAIETPCAVIVATYQTEAIVDSIEAAYRANVAGVPKTLEDEGLSGTLDAVAGAADTAQRVALIGEARGTIERC